MSRTSAFAALALLACAAVPAEEPAERRPGDPVDCVVSLRNGSVVHGRVAGSREVKIRRKGEVKAFALEKIWSVAWDSVEKEAMDRVMTPDGAFEGELQEMDPIDLDTGYGVLRIPADAVRSLRVLHPAVSFGSTFDDASLAGWTPRGASRWTAAGGSLTVQPAATGDLLVYGEELDGPWTLEVDVTCTDWAAIVFHVGEGEPAVGLWLIPGSVSFYGNGNWKNALIRSWPAAVRSGVPARVRLEVDGKRAKVSLDGTALGEIEIGTERGKIGFGCWTAPATFDNLKVTR